MANILQYVQRTDPALSFQQPTPRARTLDSGFSALAEGIAVAQDAYEKRMEEQGRAWAADALSQTRLEWTVELQRRQENAEEGAPEFTAAFIKDFDEYSKKVLESAPTPQARKFLHERLSEVRVGFGEKAATFEAAARVDYRDSKFNKAIDNAQKLMAVDPAQFESVLAENLALINSSALPPKKREDMRQKAVISIASASVTSRIQKDPGGFLRSIALYGDDKGQAVNGVTGDKAFDILPFDTRTKLVSEALQLKNSLDTAADRALEKQNKERRNEIMKEAFSLAYPEDGAPSRLTRSWVEMMRPLLDDKEYESLLKLQRGDSPDSRSDPAVFREVQRLLYEDPDRARVYALQQHKNGMLRDTDLKDAMTRSETLGRQGGPKTQYERTRQRITGNLDPGPLVKDPVGKTRFAEALYEFDEWAEAGNRTDAEIQEKGLEIIKRYRSWDPSKMLPPKPDGTTPREKALKPIGDEWNKTKADYAAKRISKAEYDAKAADLKAKWQRIEEQYKDDNK